MQFPLLHLLSVNEGAQVGVETFCPGAQIWVTMNDCGRIAIVPKNELLSSLNDLSFPLFCS